MSLLDEISSTLEAAGIRHALIGAAGASPEALPLLRGLRPWPLRRPCGARGFFVLPLTPG